MGTVIGSSSNNDYSVLSLATTRMHFEQSWQIFTDVVLRPSFTKEDVGLVQQRQIVSLSDDTDNPDVYLQKLQERVAYAGHPYLNNTNGTVETVLQADSRRSAPVSHEADGDIAFVAGDCRRSESG
jgi:zinc protease